MLTYLRITNFALIDDVELSLGPGMSVLTGETGAGKSMILHAVSLLRGGRASSDFIRAGAEEARIEAIFCPEAGSPIERQMVERLQTMGISIPDLSQEGISVRRVLGSKGRNRVYIAGQLVQTSTLSEICGSLIDLSSQHEHQTLMEVGRHLGILDRSGVDESLLERMASTYAELEKIGETLRGLEVNQESRAQREDFLRFQLQELQTAGLQIGEEEELKQERDRLRFADRLRKATQGAEESLYSSDSAILAELERIRKELVELGAIDRQLLPWAIQLQEAQTLLEDVAGELRRYLQSMTASPDRLLEIEERLHLITKVLRKYGPNIEVALKRQESLKEELFSLDHREEYYRQAQLELQRVRAEAQKIAESLSAQRKRVAERLGKEASLVLRALAMPHARLEVQVEDRASRDSDAPIFLFASKEGKSRRLGPFGWDRCELLFSPNFGEEVRPLQRIASGGELSRILLALKQVFGQADFVPTYVFDEIDTGIGGGTADQVGKHLLQLTKRKQLLCITHLPQIAAYANAHFVVEKKIEQGRTLTQVRALSPKERQEELARMLGGAKITARTRAHARELLEEAK